MGKTTSHSLGVWTVFPHYPGRGSDKNGKRKEEAEMRIVAGTASMLEEPTREDEEPILI